METKFLRMTFGNGDLVVSPDSQLDALAQLNPAACVQYADVLLQELEIAMATCTIDASALPPASSFEQIHALKNMVSSTGCQPLLAACVTLQCRSTSETHRAELRAEFNEIAQSAQCLIATYRNGLAASMPT